MASPVLSQKTYRLTKIPLDSSIEEIWRIFSVEDRKMVQTISLADALGPSTVSERIATVTFRREPQSLQKLSFKFGNLLTDLVGDVEEKFSTVWIDMHFHGMTPLNTFIDERHAVEIVAITGLAGKGFASWQCDDGSMWLRDHLPIDAPNIRVSIYGYSSEIGNSDSVVTLSEFTSNFLLSLENDRQSGHRVRQTPLILIGHCIGGMIIKDSDGSLVREGPKQISVREGSACLYWANETRIPINENHSMIGKLSQRQGSAYHAVKDCLYQFVLEARDVITVRFFRQEICDNLRSIAPGMMFLLRMIPTLKGLEPSLKSRFVTDFHQVHSFCMLLGDEQSCSLFLGDHVSPTFITGIASTIQGLRQATEIYRKSAWHLDLAFHTFGGRQGSSFSVSTDFEAAETIETELFSPSTIQELTQKIGSLLEILHQRLSMLILYPQDSSSSAFHARKSNNVLDGKVLTRTTRPLAHERERDGEYFASLHGSLEILAQGSSKEDIIVGRFTTGVKAMQQLVVVEYKQYLNTCRRQYQPLSQVEKQQINSTKLEACRLIEMLRHSHNGSHEEHETQDPILSVLRCIGYLEQEAQGRVALIYEIPDLYTWADGRLSSDVITLRRGLNGKRIARLPLEQRFSLARQLCVTVHSLHESGWLHKTICSGNVLLLRQFDSPADQVTEPSTIRSKRWHSLLKGFEFSSQVLVESNSMHSFCERNLYQHLKQQRDMALHFTKEHDIYSLGLILLEIGTGIAIEDLYAKAQGALSSDDICTLPPEDCKNHFLGKARELLPSMMGSKYTNTVTRCLEANFGVDKDDKAQRELTLAFQRYVVIPIASCMNI